MSFVGNLQLFVEKKITTYYPFAFLTHDGAGLEVVRTSFSLTIRH